MLRRLLTLALATALIVSLTMQVVPRAQAESGAHDCCPMDMGNTDDGADRSDVAVSAEPCKGLTPACIAVMGCVVTVAVPLQAPALTPVVLAWIDVAFTTATAMPAGRSIPPDPFPPNLLG